MTTRAPSLPLNSGVTIPQIGLGTSGLDDDHVADALVAAVEIGYRLVDTATIYGNERGVGLGLRNSAISRDEIFVTTKVRGGDQGYDRTLRAFDESIDRLGLDYVDLYLIHWPIPARGLFVETWRALQKLLAESRVRAIGVSNFTEEHLARLSAETEIVPAVNQVELHPGFSQKPLRGFDEAHGIVTESYSPLGEGRSFAQNCIVDAAERHGKTPAQIVLRWHIEHGLVAIPKSGSTARLRENFQIFDFSLSAAEVASIDGLDSAAGRLGSDPDVYVQV